MGHGYGDNGIPSCAEVRYRALQRAFHYPSQQSKVPGLDSLLTIPSERCLDRSGVGNVKDFDSWNERMLENLTTFIRPLSETDLVWMEFQSVDKGYFDFEDNHEANIYLQSISKAHSELRIRLASLEALKVKLMDFNRYEVGFNLSCSCQLPGRNMPRTYGNAGQKLPWLSIS